MDSDQFIEECAKAGIKVEKEVRQRVVIPSVVLFKVSFAHEGQSEEFFKRYTNFILGHPDHSFDVEIVSRSKPKPCPKCGRETPECAFEGHVFRGVYWCSYCCHRFDEVGRTIVVELEHCYGHEEKVKP